jgi:hypothetical protein
VAATDLSQPMANSVTAVYGSWIVPTVTGPSRGSTHLSEWVGIDGCNNPTVEQVGTAESVVNGKASYYAWWEMYSSGIGQPEQRITSMKIRPGDSITASVQYITSGANAGSFELTIVDNSRPGDAFTTYQTSAQTQSPLAQRACAEWIVEAPTQNGQITTPAHFGQVTFSDASAVINGVSGPIGTAAWQSQPVNLTTNGVTIDTTSKLTVTGSGSSFVVTDDTAAPTLGNAGAKHNGSRRSHAVVHPKHHVHKKASSHMASEAARNALPVPSGPRTAIRQHQRPARGFWFGPLGS